MSKEDDRKSEERLEITLEEVLELVTFTRSPEGDLLVQDVLEDVHGDVYGAVGGNVGHSVWGDVGYHVGGKIGITE